MSVFKGYRQRRDEVVALYETGVGGPTAYVTGGSWAERCLTWGEVEQASGNSRLVDEARERYRNVAGAWPDRAEALGPLQRGTH